MGKRGRGRRAVAGDGPAALRDELAQLDEALARIDARLQALVKKSCNAKRRRAWRRPRLAVAVYVLSSYDIHCAVHFLLGRARPGYRPGLLARARWAEAQRRIEDLFLSTSIDDLACLSVAGVPLPPWPASKATWRSGSWPSGCVSRTSCRSKRR